MTKTNWQRETAERIVAETFGDFSAPIDPGDVLAVTVEAMQAQEIRGAEKLAKALAEVAHHRERAQHWERRAIQYMLERDRLEEG